MKGERGDSLCSINIKMEKIKGSGWGEEEMVKSQKEIRIYMRKKRGREHFRGGKKVQKKRDV